jgi:hypothetical protein
MSLVLQSSGGGQITIQEPATASNFTQTLPAADGTLVLAGTTPTFNGITFPATAVPSADANTLDDYEEGTWTPTVTSSSGSLTSSTASGQYTKIGNEVTIQGYVLLNTVGTASGLMNLTVPFTCKTFVSGSRGQFTGTVRESEAVGNIFFIVLSGNASTAFIQTSTNGAITWTNNFVYAFTLKYLAA